ncbi:NUDIX hydrolase [Actinocatenispora rupis]|uniref:NUDIX hydrolase n=1 Tax=Actinocatenispora rupis TaxID=519421 RepID=A0A8J3NAC0_9ACTN|nr:NUDIX domain-containing protein [Actinocatenispora rupis]GID11946.1 NUDIX hydrolase [Actinocatenispora rupis]
MTPLYDDAVRVLTDWRPEPARDRTLALLSAGPDAMYRAHPAGHVTASALVLDHAYERVLLCLHGRIRRWMQLGGHCEPADTSLAAAALREATEESGIAGLRLVPEPIDVDIHEVTCGGRPSYHHDVRYVVVAPPGARELVSDESAALGWFRPGELPSPLADATERLIAPALAMAARHPA